MATENYLDVLEQDFPQKKKKTCHSESRRIEIVFCSFNLHISWISGAALLRPVFIRLSDGNGT